MVICCHWQTSEVNQGDKLEHDFTCVLTVLMFPIRHLCQQPLTDVTTFTTDNTTVTVISLTPLLLLVVVVVVVVERTD